MASPPLLMPTLPAQSSSSTTRLEPLRPTRLSAPVIARLIRSTTTIQELADVVQQQSAYFDTSHVGIALLHLALLTGRQQRQQQAGQRPAGQPSPAAAATAAPARAGVGAAPSAAVAGSTAAPADAPAGSSGPVELAPGADSLLMRDIHDDDEPLTMSSILDDDGGGGGAGGERQKTGAGSLGSSGSEGNGADVGPSSTEDARAAAQSAELLDAAAADAPPPAGAGAEESGAEAPTRVVAAAAAGAGSDCDAGAGGAQAAGSPRPADADTARRSGAGASSSGAAPATAAGAAAASTAAARSPAAATLRMLLSAVFSRLGDMSGSDLASVVSALAALRFPDRAVAEQLLLALSLRLYECRAQELPNVMCAAALLGVPPDPDFRTSFYAAVRAQVRRFGPRELAMTLWAYGAVGTDVQEDAVLVLLENSRPKLSSFSPMLLAKAAQGLAALRYRPPAEWVEAYSSALRPALRRCASRELCALLLALSSLQIGLDAPTRATLLVHTLSVLPSLAPSELALSIASLGRLTASAGPALLDLDASARVLDATATCLRCGAFSGGELVQLLEGLTRLALQPPLEWMQDYVEALRPRLRELDARQLAGVLGSLAAQQYRPQPELQEVVLEATRANMQQLLSDTTCTASLVTALRRLSIEPPPAWVDALLAASRSALKNRATDLHLANLAASLAAWGVRPDGRWAARLMWRSQVLMCENRMSPRALVALLQAMSSLGLRPNATWTALCLRAAVSRSSTPAFEPQHFSTLLASLHALGIRPRQEWLQRILQSTYRCWDRFGVSTWSSMLPALVLLQARPPLSWLSRFEASSAPRLADCSALQLLALLASLHQLHQLAAAGFTTAGCAEAGPLPATPPPPPPPPQAAGSGASGGAARLPLSSPQRLAACARPGAAWLDAWWAASGRLLGRMRYAPSELVLTASWLASLGLRPPPEWLQSCASVAARYAKVMEPAEQQQLAAALLPLLGPAAAEAVRHGATSAAQAGTTAPAETGDTKEARAVQTAAAGPTPPEELGATPPEDGGALPAQQGLAASQAQAGAELSPAIAEVAA